MLINKTSKHEKWFTSWNVKVKKTFNLTLSSSSPHLTTSAVENSTFFWKSKKISTCHGGKIQPNPIFFRCPRNSYWSKSQKHEKLFKLWIVKEKFKTWKVVHVIECATLRCPLNWCRGILGGFTYKGEKMKVKMLTGALSYPRPLVLICSEQFWASHDQCPGIR